MVNGSVNALHIALAAAVVGWLMFSLSHSVAVWKKRNASEGSGRHFGLLCAALALCCVALLGSWFNRELTRRAGVIAGTDFFVVRARAGATAHLVESSSLGKGAALVTYETPQAEREEERLRGAMSVLEEQMQMKALQPGVLNPELLRKAQEQADTQRARLTQLGFGMLTRQPGAHPAGNDDLLEAERAKQQAAELQLQRTASLVQDGVMAREKLDAASAAAHTATQELHAREQLVAATEAGSADFARMEAAISRDGERARAERSAELAELGAQRAELGTDLTMLASQQVVSAPFSGTVVYRHPSPALAADGQVILALAKGAGFVATIQVPAREAAMLHPGQQLSMKLEHSLVSEEVSGKLVTARAAAGSDGRTDLLIECSLPTEQFAAFSSGTVPVTLEWRPALLSDRFAQIGLALAALLAGRWLIAYMRFAQSRSANVETPEAAEVDRVLARLDRSVEPTGVAK